MRHAPLIVAAALAAAPLTAAAQETDEHGGRSLMQDGARQFLEGLMEEMDPALEGLEGMARELGPQLRDFAGAMGPALRDMLDEVEDWSAYHPPERLPNGDIIIRRREDAPQPEAEPDGPIDL